MKAPKTVGESVDLLFALRTKRKQKEAETAAMKEEEAKLEDAIFGKFEKADLEGARGRRAQASVSSSDVPTLDDWQKLEKHLRRTGEFDLLQRRLSVEAVRERWEAKKAVPGVGVFTRIRLHLTAVKQ